MKKYVMLTVSSLAVIALLFGIRSQMRQAETPVKLITVVAGTVSRTVSCNGKVEMANGKEVYVPSPCIAGKVHVRVGQTVKEGDTLFEVDSAATAAAMSQIGSLKIQTPDIQEVTAPVSGKVSQLNVKSGGIAETDTPCAVITSNDDLQITAAVREKNLSLVKVGQPVRVTGVGFGKQVYTGTVTALANTAHQQYFGSVTETVVDAVVTLDPPVDATPLRAGLNATASIVVSTYDDALLIPYECVAQNKEGQEYVYCWEDGMAVRRYLDTTEDFPDGILVVSGISSGAQLVQNPEELDGERVPVCEEQ